MWNSENAIAELVTKGTTDLCISNNAGVDDFGLGCFCKTPNQNDFFVRRRKCRV
jgi:acyl CoA:acetate/3-ketoacid CoA transferase alpha subunit